MIARFSKRKLIASLALILSAACLAPAAYIPLKAALAQVLLERAWVRGLVTGAPQSPWGSLDAKPLARLYVPHLGQSDIVMNSSSGQALAFGPSHMAQTARPGAPGLSVIAAHKNTHFSYVKDLAIGDELVIETINGQSHSYEVTSAQIVHADHSGLFPTDLGPPQLALVTCYPFDALSYGGPLRYIIHARIKTAIIDDSRKA